MVTAKGGGGGGGSVGVGVFCGQVRNTLPAGTSMKGCTGLICLLFLSSGGCKQVDCHLFSSNPVQLLHSF